MRVRTAILLLLNGTALFSLCIGCQPALAAPAATYTVNGIQACFYGFNVAASPAAQSASEKSGSEQHGYLHTNGVRMLNGSDHPILLRGVNTGAWLLSDPFWYDGGASLEGSWDQGEDEKRLITAQIVHLIGDHPQYDIGQIKKTFRDNFITKADVAHLKAEGFNSIRVPIDYRLFGTVTTTSEGYHLIHPVTTAPGFICLDQFIAWCRAAGVYVILDMHVAPHGFSEDQNALGSLAGLWRAIAERYRTEPFLGGYDLLNEPNWNGEKYTLNATEKGQDWNAGTQFVEQRLIDAIRLADRNHMIIAEGFMFGDRLDSVFYGLKTGALTQSLQLRDPARNLALSFHHYGGKLPEAYDPAKDAGPDGSHYWWDAYPEFTLPHNKKLAALAGVPLWVGEFGNEQNMWYHRFTRLSERNTDPTDYGASEGWCLWTYKKGGYDVLSNAPQTPGMARIDAYWNALKAWWNNKEQGAQPQPDFTAAQADAWLHDAAMKTNDRYCGWNRDVVDALLRPDFDTHAIPYVHGMKIPGRLYAANYDMGANGVAYHDTDDYNDTWSYRCDGVDLSPCEDAGPGPGFKVNNFKSGEWLRYTVWSTPGTYALRFRYSLGGGSAALRVKVNGEDVSGPVTLPATGGGNDYATVTAPGIRVKSSGVATVEIDCELGMRSLLD